MKEQKGNLLWGFVLIGLGVIITLKSVFGYDIDIFFNGWWTLFIIVPSLKNILNKNAGFMSFAFFGGGVILLLEEQNLLAKVSMPTLIVSILFFSVGFSMLFNNKGSQKKNKVVNQKQGSLKQEVNEEKVKVKNKSFSGHNQTASDITYTSGPVSEYEEQLTSELERLQREKVMASEKTSEYEKDTESRSINEDGIKIEKEDSLIGVSSSSERTKQKQNGYKKPYESENYGQKKVENISAILGSNFRQYVLEEFHRCNITSILGNVQVDIRNSQIEGDIYMDVTCILGGIDIYVPSNIRIVNQTTNLLSEVESKIKEPNDLSKEFYTLYIRGTCILGGIEIK